MKNQSPFSLFSLLACIVGLAGCTPTASQPPTSGAGQAQTADGLTSSRTAPVPVPPAPPAPKIDGIWRYEGTAVVEAGIILKDNKAVTERIDLRVSSEGTADMKWKHDDRIVDSIVGSWKLQGDLLSITRPDSAFSVFRVVAVDAAELRILTRHGKLYRLTRIPN